MMFSKEPQRKCLEKWVLDEDDFEFFRQKIAMLASISMKNTKRELIRSRLRGRAEELGHDTYASYRSYLAALPETSSEWQVFINLLTTNKTDFFRESKHFHFLENTFLPNWIKQKKKNLNVWSCAASTGEEPYTLAMILERALPADFDYRILATDIDTNVLQHAANGVYSKSKLHEIPEEFQESCLSLGSGEVEPWFAIKNKLRKKIVFQQHNLMNPTSPSNEEFDLIFCRNVLIYFNRETVEQVAKNLHAFSSKNGVLIISHSESLFGMRTDWEMAGPSIFNKA